jgi:hypothetical protein
MATKRSRSSFAYYFRPLAHNGFIASFTTRAGRCENVHDWTERHQSFDGLPRKRPYPYCLLIPATNSNRIIYLERRLFLIPLITRYIFTEKGVGGYSRIFGNAKYSKPNFPEA